MAASRPWPGRAAIAADEKKPLYSAPVSQDTAALIQRQIDQGAPAEAIVAARRALEHASGESRGHVLLALATAYFSTGQYLEALRAAIAASDTFWDSDCRSGVCEALVRIGASLRAAGDHASAITTLEQAEVMARDMDDPLRLAQVLRNVGVCCSLVGRHQQALSCLREAGDILARAGNTTEQLTLRLSLYNADNRQAEALPADSPERLALLQAVLEPWLALARDCAAHGSARLEVMARGNHAITLHQCGRHAEAIVELRSLLGAYRGFGLRPNEGLCFSELGHCHQALGEFAVARDTFLQAIAILRDAGTLDDLQRACEGLSAAEEALGEHRAALAALKEVRQIDKRKSDAAARSAVAQRELRIELARLSSQWAQLATQDPLTGLGNRRALDHWMADHLPQVEHGAPLTLLLLDLDHFKQVNDRFGHGVGDEVLRRTAAVIQASCRSRDLAVRYGGEEFVLALASVDCGDAIAIAHRLRASLQAQPWGEVAPELCVSVSIGVAEATETFDAAALLTLADRRLYAAKYGGRNQVVVAG